MLSATILWILTILVPIHGGFYLGIRQERIRVRKLTLTLWKMRNKR